MGLLLALSAGCDPHRAAIPLSASAPILLFNGAGTSPNDVAALEAILADHQMAYSTANSLQLNEMTEARLRAYRLLIVPGGNFIDMGNDLAPPTLTNVRNAVSNGTSYLGICAGAFLAGGSSHYPSFGIVAGIQFKFYAAEHRGIRKASVAITRADGTALDQYWEDGPELTGWGEVVAKYPDGTPAITEGNVGSGTVILSGVHPEAPASWRRGLSFKTPVEVDTAFALSLIESTLHRAPLSHY